MAKWLTIIGMGDNGFESLSLEQQNICTNASIIFGSSRQLAALPVLKATFHKWQSPFKDNIETIKTLHKQEMENPTTKAANIVILATGDPMHYGIGATLVKHFSVDEMTILPSPSAFSLASARMGWRLQDVVSTSIHGRSIHLLNQHITHNAKIICLTSNGGDIDNIADLLADTGYGKSKLAILEHMGGKNERVLNATANGWEAGFAGHFNTIAIEIIADVFTSIIPNIAGLDDGLYVHDGQITKADMRAITLNKLLPTQNSIMWDLGAGCGSVGIEYLRLAKNSQCHAVETSVKRIGNIQNNANSLGVPYINIHEGDNLGTIATLPRPDVIFVGGGLSLELFKKCYDILPVGGRFVTNIVTLEGLATIQQILALFEGEFSQLHHIKVSQHSDATLELIGGLHAFRPKITVTQLALVKTAPQEGLLSESTAT